MSKAAATKGPVLVGEEVATTAELGARLDDLWDAERCAWHLDYHGSPPSEFSWVAILEWTQECGNDHHADWVTYTWQFDGATTEEVLADAVAWCEGLVPFRRCDECGGDGQYGKAGQLVTCEACNGSGLASLDTTQGSEKPPRRLWRHLPQDDGDLVLTVARVLCDWNGVAGDDPEQAAYILNALYDNGYRAIFEEET